MGHGPSDLWIHNNGGGDQPFAWPDVEKGSSVPACVRDGCRCYYYTWDERANGFQRHDCGDDEVSAAVRQQAATGTWRSGDARSRRMYDLPDGTGRFYYVVQYTPPTTTARQPTLGKRSEREGEATRHYVVMNPPPPTGASPTKHPEPPSFVSQDLLDLVATLTGTCTPRCVLCDRNPPTLPLACGHRALCRECGPEWREVTGKDCPFCPIAEGSAAADERDVAAVPRVGVPRAPSPRIPEPQFSTALVQPRRGIPPRLPPLSGGNPPDEGAGGAPVVVVDLLVAYPVLGKQEWFRSEIRKHPDAWATVRSILECFHKPFLDRMFRSPNIASNLLKVIRGEDQAAKLKGTEPNVQGMPESLLKELVVSIIQKVSWDVFGMFEDDRVVPTCHRLTHLFFKLFSLATTTPSTYMDDWQQSVKRCRPQLTTLAVNEVRRQMQG